MSYFSDREGRSLPRTKEVIDQDVWAAILSILGARISDGSLGLGFPLVCPDGSAVCGTDEIALWDRAVAEIPRLRNSPEEGRASRQPWRSRDDSRIPWRPDRGDPPPTDAILDLCVLFARNVGGPEAVSHHSYYRHDHLRYDREAGLIGFAEDLNRLFARAGLAFEMEADGSVRRLLPAPLRSAIAETEFATGDPATDDLLARAAALLASRDPDAHQDAVEKLWDAFERIKTLHPGHKKQSSEALLAAAHAPDSPTFNTAIEAEFRALTDLGNKLRIRHSETDKEAIASRREPEYLFHRLFALLRYVLAQTGRLRRA